MSNLHRAQIYIEEDQMQRLKLEAKTRDIDWESDSLTKAIGKIKLTVTDASVAHDHYLYGRKKGK